MIAKTIEKSFIILANLNLLKSIEINAITAHVKQRIIDNIPNLNNTLNSIRLFSQRYKKGMYCYTP